MRTGVCIGLVLAPVLALLGCYEANDPDPRAGVLVSPTSGLVTSEATVAATFTIVLLAPPAADVVIDLASTNVNEGTVLPVQLTFTPADWNVPQTVTVTGVNDAPPAVDGPVAYTVTTALTSADPDYAAIDPEDVSVTNADDDVAGITVTPVLVPPATGLTTTEALGTAQFTVALDTVPSAAVTIDFTSTDPTEGTLASVPLTLTFAADATALNPQTVTVTGADDGAADGDIAYTILSAAAVSADPNYGGLNPGDVPVTNLDDDTPGIVATPTSLIVAEGSSDTFGVALASEPTGNVVITVASSDTLEVGVSPASLTFTALNWSTPQTVTVTPVDDAVVEATENYTVTLSVDDAASADDYDPVPDVTVAVSVQDNDGSVWTKSGSNPVLSPEPPNAWDDKYVHEPSVRLVSASSYEMWFEGGNQKGQKHEQIGRATSTDGLAWGRNPGSPVFTHTGLAGFDKNGVGDPSVLFDGATYRMWYGGRANAATKDRIGLATSADGIAWVRNATNPLLTGTAGQWDATGVGSPHVVYDGATYYMWYTGNVAGTRAIGAATSPDGAAWTKPLTVPVVDVGGAGSFDSDGAMSCCVILDGATYRMWYTGLAADGVYRIGYATSADGMAWTKGAGNPVLSPGAAGSWDATGVMAPWVIKDGTTLRMWYVGRNAAGTYQIGYAQSSD